LTNEYPYVKLSEGKPEPISASRAKGKKDGILPRLPDIRSRDSSVGIATRYGWKVRVSNLGGGEIFRTRPDRPWGPPSLLYNGYRVVSGGKAAGAWG
jgi:hypothetical protein